MQATTWCHWPSSRAGPPPLPWPGSVGDQVVMNSCPKEIPKDRPLWPGRSKRRRLVVPVLGGSLTQAAAQRSAAGSMMEALSSPTSDVAKTQASPTWPGCPQVAVVNR